MTSPMIYRFSQSCIDWKVDAKAKKSKATLGGKGAGLVMMAQIGLNVPPGFTIPCEACLTYQSFKSDIVARNAWMDKLMAGVADKMDWLTKQFGYSPLVSVRSGAPVSMPGMMDTILNVGLCSGQTLAAWDERIGFRAAWDSYRRLIQMLGATAYGVPSEHFEKELSEAKKKLGVSSDSELTAAALTQLVKRYKQVFQAATQQEFPNDPMEQLRAAIEAVFRSWMNPRAIEYRKLNKIDEKMGTAVNVQSMVFGNMGATSGTGVLFSRDPSTGYGEMMGEFLVDAQGEDVVAGVRTPVDVREMQAMTGTVWPMIFTDLEDLCVKLEDAYHDMVDIEFTVQKGELFVLQSRTGKRSARAAFKIAVELVKEGMIDQETALSRLTPGQYKAVTRPTVDPKWTKPPDVVGLPACPGVVSGRPVFSSGDAVAAKDPVVLVTAETSPDDIAGMAAAVGVLTRTGGATSHAAVVARAMDKTCVVGCTLLDLTDAAKAKIKKVTIDGASGNVWFNCDVPVVDGSSSFEVREVEFWCSPQCVALPTPIEDDVDQTIFAAYWWDQPDVADAVLDGLAELPSRQRVALDLRPPSEFMEPSDAKLNALFADAYDNSFLISLVARLLQRKDDLTGLRLVLPDNWSSASVAAVFEVCEAGCAWSQAVPREHAVFARLAS